MKPTALLSSIPGATETSNGPLVAPDGMVSVSDVALQLLIVTAAPFSSTVLPPCVAPKPVPAITTWLPTDPVVAETPVIAGAGDCAEPTDRKSTRLNSSHLVISYAVFCLKKKKNK